MTALDSILVLFLVVMTMATWYSLYLLRSRSLSPPSPTPTSMPEKPSEALIEKMMEMMRTERSEDRRLMETLVLGREVTSEPSTMSSLTLPMEFDYDSTPLPPGIEAVMSREAEEDLLEAGRRERDALLAKRQELEAEVLSRMAQGQSETSSPGPWLATEDESGLPT